MSFLPTDIPELRGYETGVVLSNIARMQERYISLGEVTLAQLNELARAVCHDAGGDPDTVDSILLSLQNEGEEYLTTGWGGESDSPLGKALDINRDMLARMYRQLGLNQRLALYRCLTDMLHPEHGGGDRNHLSDGLTPGARGRVAYMGGDLSDKAYLAFAGTVPDCRAALCHSFVDACEEVYNRLCEYCILPLESTDQGRLTAFARLIVKYGLCIVAACDVISQTQEESRATRFGLLCRNAEEPVETGTHGDTARRTVFPPIPILCDRGGVPRYLEILHVTATDPYLTDLLTAASFCGMQLRRADGLSVNDARPVNARAGAVRQDDLFGDNTHARKVPPPLCLVLDTWSDVPTDGEASRDATPADMLTFLHWLALEAPEDRVMGMYSLL